MQHFVTRIEPQYLANMQLFCFRLFFLAALPLLIHLPLYSQPMVWKIQQGAITFRSDAPLEAIEATSGKLQGVIDPQDQTFAFAVFIQTFEGFNSPLQREHFNENYLESKRYPRATFNGRILDEVDFSTPGTYEVRVKGRLVIHGVGQERIIRGQLHVRPNQLQLTARFSVLLNEHNIAIPKVVHQKIAEEINVTVSGTFQPGRP